LEFELDRCWSLEGDTKERKAEEIHISLIDKIKTGSLEDTEPKIEAKTQRFK